MPGRGWSRDADPGPRLPGLLPWQILLLAAVCGILTLHLPAPGLVGLALVALAARRLDTGRWVRGPAFAPAMAAAFLLALGYAWLCLPGPAPGQPGWMARGEAVTISGTVVESQTRYEGKLRVILDEVRIERGQGGSEVLPGRLVWAWEQSSQRPAPGQAVRFTGRVRPVRWFGNPGSGSYDFLWRTRGAYWRAYVRGDKGVEFGPAPSGPFCGSFHGLFHDLRLDLLERVQDALPDTPGGAMVRALLFGDRLKVAEKEYEVLASAGLAHTLALSGLHVGFVVLLGFALARLVGLVRPRAYLRVPRPKLGVLLAAPLVLAYLWLGESSPSLVRAVVMFAFWGALLLLGRQRVLLDGLFLAVALILAVTPLALFDLRFQLSVLAVAGIAAAMPWVLRLDRAWHWPWRPLGWMAGLLCISLAANLATLPLTAWYFGRLTPNLLLNVFWVPLLGLGIMPLSLSGLALVPVWPDGGAWLLDAAARGLDWMLLGLDRLSDFGAFPQVFLLRPWWPAMLGLGLVLVAVTVALSGRRRRPDWLLVLVAAALLLAPPVAGLVRDARPEVRLAVLDVGKGQSLLVTAPGGVRWIIDGGGSMGGSFDMGQSVVGPCLAYGHPPLLNGALLTHPHLDHYQGVVWLLNNFQVEAYAHNGRPIQSSYKQPLLNGLDRNGLDPVVLSAGERLVLNPGQGGDLVLETLHPSRPLGKLSTNDASLVLRLVWRGRSLALLPADVEVEGIRALLASGADLSAEVLVLPHHGSGGSLSPEFYRAVGPRLAVASMAWGGASELPAPAVRKALDAIGIPLLTTAEQGMVEVSWRWGGPGFEVRSHRFGVLEP